MRLCEELGMGVIAHDPDTALDIDNHNKRLAKTTKLYAVMFGEEAGHLWHEDAGHEAALLPAVKLEAGNAKKGGKKTARRLPGPESAKTAQTKMNVCGEEELKVFAKTLTGKIVTVYAHATDTIYELKSRIYDSEGVPPNMQVLIFDSKHMENGRTLLESNIVNESTVHLCTPLRGC
eukprot:gene2403-8712_t